MSDLRVDITVESSNCDCGPYRRSDLELHTLDCAAALEAQRRSFAYGNAAIGNPRVTRELIDRIADRDTIDVTPKKGLAWWVRILVRLAKWVLRRYVP